MKTLLAQLLGISTSLLNYFLPILQSAVAGSLSRLLPLALNIVAELAIQNNLGNAEKRAAALQNLQRAAVVEGIQCSVSILNLAVETAVVSLKQQGQIK
jgi:hypothetical protein